MQRCAAWAVDLPVGHPAGCSGRALRVAVFALISALLALGAHRFSGGAAPSTLAVLAAVGVLVAVGWPMSRRERTGRQLGLLVVGTQALAHLWFVLPAVLTAVRVRGPGGTSSLVALLFCHHGRTPITPAQLDAATRGIDLGSLPGAAPQQSPAGLIWQMAAMLLAHLIAAALVACWLRVGESAAWSAVRRVVRALHTSWWTPAPAGVRLVVELRAPRLFPHRWAGPLSGRGPPAARITLLAA